MADQKPLSSAFMNKLSQKDNLGDDYGVLPLADPEKLSPQFAGYKAAINESGRGDSVYKPDPVGQLESLAQKKGLAGTRAADAPAPYLRKMPSPKAIQAAPEKPVDMAKFAQDMLDMQRAANSAHLAQGASVKDRTEATPAWLEQFASKAQANEGRDTLDPRRPLDECDKQGY